MSQSLFVNGKEYVPSTLLSKQFGYTSDYISKLARDEKVLGTRIGRQWFIEPESLRIFVQQSEIQKRLNKEHLSIQRKIERERKNASHATNDSVLALTNHRRADFHALAESLVVMMCVALVGGLGWVSITSDLGFSDFTMGARQTLATVSEAIVSDALVFPNVNIPSSTNGDEFFNAVSSGGDIRVAEVLREQINEIEGSFTNLPVFPQPTTSEEFVVVGNESVPLENFVQQQYFSDEVVVTEDEGAYLVEPIFKTPAEAEALHFELVSTERKTLNE